MACQNCYSDCDGNIIRDKCVTYTGPDIPALGIVNGDSISVVEQTLITQITSISEGLGINLTTTTLPCQYLIDLLAGKDLTLKNALDVIFAAQCAFKASLDGLEQGIATTFVTQDVIISPNYNNNVNTLLVGGGRVLKGGTTVQSWNLAQTEFDSLDPTLSYYLYAQISITGAAAQYVLYSSPVASSDATYYYVYLANLYKVVNNTRRIFALTGTSLSTNTLDVGLIKSADASSYWDLNTNKLVVGNATSSVSYNTTVPNLVTLKGAVIQRQDGTVVQLPAQRGAYVPTVVYYDGDIVSYGGQSWQYIYPTPISGQTPAENAYWTIYASKGADGNTPNYTEFRYAKNGSNTTPPTLVNTDPNPSGWSISQPTVGPTEYLWFTSAIKSGVDNSLVGVWGTPNKMSGIPGPSGNVSFTELAFIRADAQPATPTGGSYNSPIPVGWSDGVPAGTSQLWLSTRIFSSDGASPQQANWTVPQSTTSTAGIQYQWSTVTTSPSDPTTTPANWSATASGADIWMAVRTITNGIPDPWQINKIKGEQGNVGVTGPAGPFLSYAGNWDASTVYYGTPQRVTSVSYGGNYYVTRSDAGSIIAGTLPTNTTYYNPIFGTYSSIATGLLLAQLAFIENLGVNFLRTDSTGQHIEVTPSYATLLALKAAGNPGFTGLSDSDLVYLANSMTFYASTDIGDRTETEIKANSTLSIREIDATTVTIPNGSGGTTTINTPASAALLLTTPAVSQMLIQPNILTIGNYVGGYYTDSVASISSSGSTLPGNISTDSLIISGGIKMDGGIQGRTNLSIPNIYVDGIFEGNKAVTTGGYLTTIYYGVIGLANNGTTPTISVPPEGAHSLSITLINPTNVSLNANLSTGMTAYINGVASTTSVTLAAYTSLKLHTFDCVSYYNI